MKRHTPVLLALLITTALASAVYAGDGRKQFRKLFNHYNAIRAELADDTVRDVGYHAERLAVLAGSLSRQALRSSDPGERESSEQLRDLAVAAREVGSARTLDDARKGFARLSEMLLEYRGTAGAGADDPVVVFCPLHNSVWLQRSGDPVSNPYLGADRARCGQKLEFRTPGWFPTRPTSRSPGGFEQHGPGGPQGR